jgi:hypothetical protein
VIEYKLEVDGDKRIMVFERKPYFVGFIYVGRFDNQSLAMDYIDSQRWKTETGWGV